MSLSRGLRGVRRRVRALMPRTEGRLLGLRRTQSGQGALEYVGLIVIVAAIIGALFATNVGPELVGSLKTSVCKVTGGDNCGSGTDDQATDGPEDGGDQPADDGGGDQPKSQAQIDYDNAVKELEDAQKAEQDDIDKAKQAAKELAKILADELGITAAFDCITKGDMGACTETVINILTSLIGGAVGKLAAKYGAPWKWKKAADLIKKIKNHGDDLYDGITGAIKNRKKVQDAQKKLDDAKRKLDDEKKDKPDEKKPDEKGKRCLVNAAANTGPQGFRGGVVGAAATSPSGRVVTAVSTAVATASLVRGRLVTLPSENGKGNCGTEVDLDSTELASIAMAARIAKGVPVGRNVAVIKIERNGKVEYLVAASEGKRGGLHSEEVLDKYLADNNIPRTAVKEVYSERAPCTSMEHTCSELVWRDWPEAKDKVSWSLTPRSGKNERENARLDQEALTNARNKHKPKPGLPKFTFVP